MNLQITVPYRTCPFKCPFCIANNPNTLGKYENLYVSDKKAYFEALDTTIKQLYLGNYFKPITIVITGDTEPTLNEVWLQEVVNHIRSKHEIAIASVELQTANITWVDKYFKSEIPMLFDVIGLSIYNEQQIEYAMESELYRQDKHTFVRPTIILNSAIYEARLGVVSWHSLSKYKQVTFKVLQDSDNPQIQAWIERNKFKDYQMRLLDHDIAKLVYEGVSVKLDRDCMDTKGGQRYVIFRENGKLYKDWSEVVYD